MSMSKKETQQAGTPEPVASDTPATTTQPPPTMSVVRSRMRTAVCGGRRPGTKLFDSAEHWSIVDGLWLTLADGSQVDATSFKLRLDNDLQLTYGQLIALAGDFYALYLKPISDQTDMQKAFVQSFDTLNRAAAPKEVSAILLIMEEEFAELEQALLSGKPAHEVYERNSSRWDTEYNKATGGGEHYLMYLSDWGRYLWIAAYNWDHFGTHAHQVYAAGLAVAMKTAAEAAALPEPQRNEKLQRAYALLAFASHYLTDSFSAGHVRTPRRHMHTASEHPNNVADFSADACAKFMHDEDNYNGLWVTNPAGDRWIAYGDGRYFDAVNLANRNVIRAAVRAAIADVHAAFTTGKVPPAPGSLTLLPVPLTVNDTNNFAPLFVVGGDPNHNGVQVRTSLSDPNRYEWGTFLSWSGLALQLRLTTAPRIGAPPGMGQASGPHVAEHGAVSAWLPEGPVCAHGTTRLTTDASPALAEYGGLLWACVKQGRQLLLGTHAGEWSDFTPLTVAGLDIQAATGPCLVVDGGTLYCFYADLSGAIQWLMYNGGSWQSRGPVSIGGSRVKTDTAPTAISLPASGFLLLVYKGFGVSELRYSCVKTSSGGWSGNQPFKLGYNALTDDQPVGVATASGG